MVKQVTFNRALVALAFVVAAILGMAFATQAYAAQADAAESGQLKASSIASQSAAAKATTKDMIWLKAGKKFYQWGMWSKSEKNGTWRPRESLTSYIEGEKASVSGIKSSKTSVMTASFKKKYGYMQYKIKKTGTAKITYTAKYTDYETGKPVVDSVTEKHRVFKYTSPVKKLKVGSTNFVKNLKSQPIYNTKKALKGKVSVTAAKGWKIVKIRKVNSAAISGEYVPQSTVKNNKTNVSIAKGKGALEVICYNKSKKYYSSVILAAGIKDFGLVFG